MRCALVLLASSPWHVLGQPVASSAASSHTAASILYCTAAVDLLPEVLKATGEALLSTYLKQLLLHSTSSILRGLVPFS